MEFEFVIKIIGIYLIYDILIFSTTITLDSSLCCVFISIERDPKFISKIIILILAKLLSD